MVKIGIVSLAHMHAFSYGAALQKIPGAQLVGIFDPDQKRGAEGAKRFSSQFFPEAEALLDQVDAVIICSENSRHREYTELAAAHGCHVLCEKPIATNLEYAKAMIDACAKAGVKLQIAFPVRFAEPVRAVKDLLDQGRIGEVVAIRGTNRGKMPGGWFIDRELAGGGAVMDHTVHVVDAVRWLLGREFISVYAEVDSRIWGIPLDDCGMLSLELEGGIIMTQDPSWSRPKSFPTWGDVTLEFVGTEGVIYLDAFAENFLVYDDGQGQILQEFYGGDMDYGLIKDFVAAVAEDREPSITGWDGLKALEVTLAAYESARRGQPVRLS